MIRMMSRSVFHNAKIQTPAGDGVAKTGQEFLTDLDHARDLQRNGLAYPVDPEAFDRKPGVPTAYELAQADASARAQAEADAAARAEAQAESDRLAAEVAAAEAARAAKVAKK